jgi:DNA-binding response OmpR family regulator
VLVVDDDAAIRRVIHDALESEGFDVLTSADPIEAFDIASRVDPELVILDVHLPNMRGERVAKKLAAGAKRKLKIVTITADDSAAESARAMSAVAYLRKPFDVNDLIRLVQTILPIEST